MSGYNPAGRLPVPRKSWWQRHRDKRVEKRRAWMKFLGGLVMQGKQREEFFAFVDSMSTDDLLCKTGDESWRPRK